MRRICSSCGTPYTWEFGIKPLDVMLYIPNVCSASCFSKLLRSNSHEQAVNAVGSLVCEPYTEQMEDGRSGYELVLMDWMKAKKIRYRYEPWKFTLPSGKRYIPDFVLTPNTFIETKGIWESEAKTKFKEFAEIVGWNRGHVYVLNDKFVAMIRRDG